MVVSGQQADFTSAIRRQAAHRLNALHKAKDRVGYTANNFKQVTVCISMVHCSFAAG